MASVAFEASSVSDGYGEALGCVAEPLVAAQPEDPSGPVVDHARQVGVWGEGSEDPGWYGSDPDHLDLAAGVGAVDHSCFGGDDDLGGWPWL